MERNIVNFIKPIAMFMITFLSALYLTKSVSIAFIVGLVPLLLGWLVILQAFAYGLACVTFLMAVAWAITPVSVKDVVGRHADSAMAELSREFGSK